MAVNALLRFILKEIGLDVAASFAWSKAPRRGRFEFSVILAYRGGADGARYTDISGAVFEVGIGRYHYQGRLRIISRV